MATAEAAREQTREYVRFNTNIPQEVALKFPEGKQVQSQKTDASGTPWPDQLMFTTTDGRLMYLPLYAGEILRELRVGPGERISVGKFEVKQGNRRGTRIQITRVDPPAEVARSVAPAAPQAAKLEGAAAQPGTPMQGRVPTQSTANGNGNGTSLDVQAPNGQTGKVSLPVNGKPPVNGNGHAVQNGIPYFDAETEMERCWQVAVRRAIGVEKYAADQNYSLRLSAETVWAMTATVFINSREGGRR